MDPTTRRRALQLGAAGAAAGVAGCLGDDETPDGTLDFDAVELVDDELLPKRENYRTDERPFLKRRLYRADDPEISLVLLHTAVFDSRLLYPLASALAEANVAHVFTPDLAGHGPDPAMRGHISLSRQLQRNVDELIEHARRVFRGKPVVVGGHGTGGGVVLRFASTSAGQRADGFLLLAPYLGRSESATTPGMGGWANFIRDRILMLNVVDGLGQDWNADMITVEYEIPDGLWDGTETLDHSYRLMRSYTPLEIATGRMVKEPTLTVVGTDDETVKPGAYEPVFGAHDERVVDRIEGASHFDLVGTDTAVRTIRRWVKETRFDHRERDWLTEQ